MKPILILIAGVVALVVGFGGAVMFLPVLAGSAVLSSPADPCAGADTVAVVTDAGGFSAEQLKNAGIVDQAARAAGLSGQATLVGLVTAIGESDLVNITYGDAAGPDSAGLFQQRPSQGWGTRSQVLDPFYAATSFYLGPRHDGTAGLVAITGWTNLPITEAIHRVQRNADPAHYTKFIGRAEAIAKAAGLDLARAGTSTYQTGSSAGPASTTCGGTLTIGTGPCPLDTAGVVGCDAALAFMSQQMTNPAHSWYRQCLGLVSQAYGGVFVGYPTAYAAALAVRAGGLMQPATTDYGSIPRGAVLWFDGRNTGNAAGHVVIAIGGGMAISNDAPVNDGRVGIVPISYFVDHWGQTFMGWSPPKRPAA